MWPFKRNPKVEYVDPAELNFTQLDFTERFDERQNLAADEWIETIPMNEMLQDGKRNNLPPAEATPDEVYEVATKLSKIRRIFASPTDGVYCPICHIANISIENLGTPCPKCQRPLLAFDWN